MKPWKILEYRMQSLPSRQIQISLGVSPQKMTLRNPTITTTHQTQAQTKGWGTMTSHRGSTGKGILVPHFQMLRGSVLLLVVDFFFFFF
jgi:hypothetical protein